MTQMVAVLSGLLMSIQGVWNTALRGSIGTWFTNTIVQGVGLLSALIGLAVVRDANLTGLRSVNKIYLLSGILSVGIVYTVIFAITKLGPAQATMLILITQMTASYLIELFGWFGMEKVDFSWIKAIGIGVILIGIVISQYAK
ncbi:MAG: hypothetical protein ATN36_06325 [Epulopiscium sp. Nele67-Bin005]|nr:MAG: hypothetical protein ATN36_06325 [Epulopiscium sp. Nele67-Bin005]